MQMSKVEENVKFIEEKLVRGIQKEKEKVMTIRHLTRKEMLVEFGGVVVDQDT